MITVINIWGDEDESDNKIEIIDDSKENLEKKKIIQQEYFESLLKRQPQLQIVPVEHR
jgi:mannitol/fructose-specific phosphotransferase system IIA component